MICAGSCLPYYNLRGVAVAPLCFCSAQTNVQHPSRGPGESKVAHAARHLYLRNRSATPNKTHRERDQLSWTTALLLCDGTGGELYCFPCFRWSIMIILFQGVSGRGGVVYPSKGVYNRAVRLYLHRSQKMNGFIWQGNSLRNMKSIKIFSLIQYHMSRNMSLSTNTRKSRKI